MNVRSALDRLKLIKKSPKGARLIVPLAFVVVIIASAVSVSAYMVNLQKKQPVAEITDNKPVAPVAKVESEPPAKTEEKPVASDSIQSAVQGGIQPAPTQTSGPATKPATKPRPHTSEDPAYVACTQKYSELYVKYNADNADINAEKSLALAIVDELYNSGFYDEQYPGGTEPYNQWQIDRAEVEAEYNNQLSALYATYAANSSAYLNC